MMKSFYFFLTSLIITSLSCFNSPDGNISDGTFEYESALRQDGTSFYAYDQAKGQINYMLDYGEHKGVWRSFGSPMDYYRNTRMEFDVVERAGAASFYLLHPATGQLYYTVDDGTEGSGQWNAYGAKISEGGNASLQFDAEGRLEGNSFYAFDTNTGQMYFMNDYGSEAGKWSMYGSKL